MNIVPAFPDENKKPEIKEERVTPQKKEFSFLASMRRIKGLSTFAYNIKTQELRILETEKKVELNLHGKPIAKERAIIDPNQDIIIQALNFKNAEKKIVKMYKNISKWKEQK